MITLIKYFLVYYLRKHKFRVIKKMGIKEVSKSFDLFVFTYQSFQILPESALKQDQPIKSLPI